MLWLARPEAFIAGFHLLDDFVRRHLVPLLLGEVSVGQHASQACSYYPCSGRNASSLAKGPAVKSDWLHFFSKSQTGHVEMAEPANVLFKPKGSCQPASCMRTLPPR